MHSTLVFLKSSQQQLSTVWGRRGAATTTTRGGVKYKRSELTAPWDRPTEPNQLVASLLKTPPPSTSRGSMDYYWFLLSCLVFSFSVTIIVAINQTVYAARIPNDGRPSVPSRSSTHHQRQISFFMQDVVLASSPRQADGNAGLDPSLGPEGGIFPSADGVPEPRPVDTTIGRGSPLFLTSLRTLELGMVSMIEDALTEGYMAGSPMVGKARGIAVSSSQAREAQMIAMITSFDENGQAGDSLRFFGLHHAGASDSHLAVIGGTGKYHEANGFATVVGKRLESSNTSLLVTVYLK